MLTLKKRIQRLEVTKPTSVFWFIHLITATQAEFRGYKVSWPDSEEVFSGEDRLALQNQIESAGKARQLSQAILAQI